MPPLKNEKSCDLLIIGSGLAGIAATLFSARRKIDALQAGLTAEMGFASGVFDLLGVHPVAEGRIIEDPWQGLQKLRRDEPRHPYSRLETADIREAMATVLNFLENSGYPYFHDAHKNIRIITPAGTLKTTYAVPHTMAEGVRALSNQSPCLLVDFKRLRGFSGRQIALSLAERWPGLRTARIRFPEQPQGELYPERMARSMESPEVRRKVIEAIRPHLGGAEVVGLPAVLGVYHTVDIINEMQHALGVPVFEVPTMLPAVTGLRLQETFEKAFNGIGVRVLRQHRVLAARKHEDGCWDLTVGDEQNRHQVKARAVLLCSGRFFGKGLHADRQGIRETIFDLPVVQPANRADWHHKDLFHPGGHPVNRAGIAVDEHFRPVDEKGGLIYDNLFAAGTILAHQDWMRQKCGSGLAIATAFGAIENCSKYLGHRS